MRAPMRRQGRDAFFARLPELGRELGLRAGDAGDAVNGLEAPVSGPRDVSITSEA